MEAQCGGEKKLLGPKRQEVGGPGDSPGPGRGNGKGDRKDTDIETLAFHGNSRDFWSEICHSFCLRCEFALMPVACDHRQA